MAKALRISLDTFSANKAVSTKYIIPIIRCRGVSGQFDAPIFFSD
jgi:hypothetical protein